MIHNPVASEQHRLALGLGPSFCLSELTRTYHNLMKKWHPDICRLPEATEKAKIFNLAYEFLSEALENTKGVYILPNATEFYSNQKATWEDLQPKHTYDNRKYTTGFPDTAVIEIFVKSSHIVSIGYNNKAQTLYIKFSDNSIYRYFGVPPQIFDSFLDASSHGRFAHKYIYHAYDYECC